MFLWKVNFSWISVQDYTVISYWLVIVFWWHYFLEIVNVSFYFFKHITIASIWRKFITWNSASFGLLLVIWLPFSQSHCAIHSFDQSRGATVFAPFHFFRESSKHFPRQKVLKVLLTVNLPNRVTDRSNLRKISSTTGNYIVGLL